MIVPETPGNSAEVDSLLQEMDRVPENEVDIRFFSVSKEKDHSSEDACAISPDKTLLAMADGVSMSSLPAPWARLLVHRWIQEPLLQADADSIQKWLRLPRAVWGKWVKELWTPYVNRNRERKGLPPLDETYSDSSITSVLTQGASSTFLGVNIDSAKRQINAIGWGDTCLFLVRPIFPYISFPLTDPSKFNDRPDQITSLDKSVSTPQTRTLQYGWDETLVLATDAVAKWLMPRISEGIIVSLYNKTADEFSRMVREERGKRALEIDDSTLLIVNLERFHERQSIPSGIPLLSSATSVLKSAR